MDLQEVGWGAWTGLIGLWKGTGGRYLKHSNEPLGSTKYRKFLHYLRTGSQERHCSMV